MNEKLKGIFREKKLDRIWESDFYMKLLLY